MLCENMQCVCVYVQRENFASLDELKEGSVFCARERANSYCNTKAIVFMFMTFFFTVKILNKLKDLATFCVHMYVQVCVVGGRGVHTDLDMT